MLGTRDDLVQRGAVVVGVRGEAIYLATPGGGVGAYVDALSRAGGHYGGGLLVEGRESNGGLAVVVSAGPASSDGEAALSSGLFVGYRAGPRSIFGSWGVPIGGRVDVIAGLGSQRQVAASFALQMDVVWLLLPFLNSFRF
jgi:hypothetical protein